MSESSPIRLRLLGVVALIFVAACSREEGGARPNVLLVTFDTTRADHIGAYGWRHAFTPTVDALAAESIKFNRAFSSVPLTLPSHTTIMTGVYPFYHGVRDNSHFVVNEGLNTLAERMKQHGYQTAAVVAAFVLDSRFGLGQGFDTYDDDVQPRTESAKFAVPERIAADVTDAAIRWLDSAQADRPFFLWAHYYDPHAVYNAPDSFTKYQGDPYDVEIAYADSELGRLLDRVEQFSANGRQTMIVFASDHGEALGQYGEPTHAYFAYDSTLHVPLLVRMPDHSHAGTEIDVPVSLADIMPTILDVIGLPVPGWDEMHGRSLLALVESESPPEELLTRPIAFECLEPHYSYGWAPVQGVRVGETKFIDSPEPELYILSENPQEVPSANRVADRPDLAAATKAAYRDLFAQPLSFPAYTATPQLPDQEVVEQLRSLGYVAAAVPEEPKESEGRDVKQMLPIYRQILSAQSWISGGDAERAVRTLITLTHEDPENERVLWMLAELAATTPSVADEALPTIKDALEAQQVPPAMIPQVLVNLGRICFQKDDNSQALRYFSEAGQADPNYAAARWWSALTCLRLDRRADAIDALRQAADLLGSKARYPQVALGWVLFWDGQKDGAVREWKTILDQNEGFGAVWRLADDCPLDKSIAQQVTPALLRYLDDKSLPDRVRAALAVVCANYLSLQQKTADALSVLNHARPLFSDTDVMLHLQLAGLHAALGEFESAQEHADRAYELAPDRLDVVALRADILERSHRLEEAVALLDAYYGRHPEKSAAANNLAWMLARTGTDLDRAIKLAKRVIARLPGDASANDTLGWIYHLRGDKEMAIRHLSAATRINPDDADYEYHLGEAYRAAGQLERAREALAKAVELAPVPRPDWYDEARAGSQAP